jgi:Tol biopolymer transport system component
MYTLMPDGHSFLYIKTDGGVSNLWSQSVEGGLPKQITHFNSQRSSTFDLSRDGMRLLIDRGIEGSHAIRIRDVR